MQKKRDRWPSQAIFIFAAIGSAVGLGNIWRFPYIVGKYGGGAFLIPYSLFLFLFGIPLLILEFSLGQKMQQGAVQALRRISGPFSGIGALALLCSFVVSCYYAVVMAWSIIYIYFSFDIAWGKSPKTFFFQDVLHASQNFEHPWMISAAVLLGLVLCWIFVYFSIWKGVKSVSAVVTITMPLPVILLMILLIRGATLPGAWDGVQYFFSPDFKALLKIEVWMAALSQILFSLTLGFGVMIAYASYEKKTSDIVKNAYIIALSNSAISIISGLVVFTTLGYMAHGSGEALSDLAASGPSLAFLVFPKALSLIPGAPFFAVFFFLMLLLLGIDSLFSLVEAISTSVQDKWVSFGKESLSLYICVFCFLGGLIFTTAAGIYFLDITDHYITFYGLTTVSLLQALAVGWYYGIDKHSQWINRVSKWKITPYWPFAIRYFAPACLLFLIIGSLVQDVTVPYGGYPEWANILLGWVMVALIIFISLLFSYILRK